MPQPTNSPARDGSAVKKGLQLLGLWFLIVLLVTSLLILIGAVTNRYRVLSVLSGSMEPTIPKGALILAFAYPAKEIRPGDTITFQSPRDTNILITHRVTGVMQPGVYPVIQTKGDANAAPDPWNLQLTDPLAWRTVFVVPYIGRVLAWLREPMIGMGLLTGLPLLLGAVWLATFWWRRFKPNLKVK